MFRAFFFPLNVIFTKFCLSYEFYFNGLKNLKSMSNWIRKNDFLLFLPRNDAF